MSDAWYCLLLPRGTAAQQKLGGGRYPAAGCRCGSAVGTGGCREPEERPQHGVGAGGEWRPPPCLWVWVTVGRAPRCCCGLGGNGRRAMQGKASPRQAGGSAHAAAEPRRQHTDLLIPHRLLPRAAPAASGHQARPAPLWVFLSHTFQPPAERWAAESSPEACCSLPGGGLQEGLSPHRPLWRVSHLCRCIQKGCFLLRPWRNLPGLQEQAVPSRSRGTDCSRWTSRGLWSAWHPVVRREPRPLSGLFQDLLFPASGMRDVVPPFTSAPASLESNFLANFWKNKWL